MEMLKHEQQISKTGLQFITNAATMKYGEATVYLADSGVNFNNELFPTPNALQDLITKTTFWEKICEMEDKINYLYIEDKRLKYVDIEEIFLKNNIDNLFLNYFMTFFSLYVS